MRRHDSFVSHAGFGLVNDHREESTAEKGGGENEPNFPKPPTGDAGTGGSDERDVEANKPK